ncbi:hypothetical protein [Candidatus Lokiarchaeum ossiferum]
MKDKFGIVGTPLEDFELPTSRSATFSSVNMRSTSNLVIVLLRDIH